MKTTGDSRLVGSHSTRGNRLNGQTGGVQPVLWQGLRCGFGSEAEVAGGQDIKKLPGAGRMIPELGQERCQRAGQGARGKTADAPQASSLCLATAPGAGHTAALKGFFPEQAALPSSCGERSSTLGRGPGSITRGCHSP